MLHSCTYSKRHNKFLKEEHEKIFFLFYTMTYGITLGIALSANLLTMYFFYELLTAADTIPECCLK